MCISRFKENIRKGTFQCSCDITGCLKVPPQTSNMYQPGFAAKLTGNFHRNKAEFKVLLCIPIILLLSTPLMIKRTKIKPLTLTKHTTNFSSELISNLKE